MNEENTHHLPYFDEVNKMYTMREAIEEAKRCLHCKVPQCKRAAPSRTTYPTSYTSSQRATWARPWPYCTKNQPARHLRPCVPTRKAVRRPLRARPPRQPRTSGQARKLYSTIRRRNEPDPRAHTRKNTRQGGRHRLRPRRPYRGRRPGAPGLQCHHIRRAARARRRADVRHTRVPTAQSRGAQRN